MKLTKEHLHVLIKEAIEQDRLAKLVNHLTSDDLSTVEHGVFLADTMGYKAELQRASSGFANKEYTIFTPSEELYNAIRKVKPLAPAGLSIDTPKYKEFFITMRTQ